MYNYYAVLVKTTMYNELSIAIGLPLKTFRLLCI
jgi:hypothetical protein